MSLKLIYSKFEVECQVASKNFTNLISDKMSEIRLSNGILQSNNIFIHIFDTNKEAMPKANLKVTYENQTNKHEIILLWLFQI